MSTPMLPNTPRTTARTAVATAATTQEPVVSAVDAGCVFMQAPSCPSLAATVPVSAVTVLSADHHGGRTAVSAAAALAGTRDDRQPLRDHSGLSSASGRCPAGKLLAQSRPVGA